MEVKHNGLTFYEEPLKKSYSLSKNNLLNRKLHAALNVQVVMQ